MEAREVTPKPQPAGPRRGRTPTRRTGTGTKAASSSRPVGLATFRDDPLYPKLTRAVGAILTMGKVVVPIDVLVAMQLLTRRDIDDWRRGRVPYLERVIHGNLTRLSRLLRILRFHAHDLNLVPSATAYVREGGGPKARLRFTKTGEPRLEAAYATQFVWQGKGPFHLPAALENTE